MIFSYAACGVEYATRERVTGLLPPSPLLASVEASVLAHAARARVDSRPAATRAVALRAVLNTMTKPFSIKKLLLLDYKRRSMIRWDVPRIETPRVAMPRARTRGGPAADRR